MIYVTGDTHGECSHYWSYREDKNWGADDCIIVCGDFGFLFHCDGAVTDKFTALWYDVRALGEGGRTV